MATGNIGRVAVLQLLGGMCFGFSAEGVALVSLAILHLIGCTVLQQHHVRAVLSMLLCNLVRVGG